MVAYKVVRNVNGKLFSAIINRGHLMTEYIVGKWTIKRKYGPLVFEGFNDAYRFTQENWRPNYRIYQCEVEDARKAPNLTDIWDMTNLNFETIRRRMDRNVRNHVISNAPIGSLITSRIKLVKLVW